MKKFYFISILLSFSLASCTLNEPYRTDYVYHEDGLIYKIKSNELYTGKIIDTTDTFILEIDVVNGKRNGEFKNYDLDGTLRIDGKMKDNLNDSLWRYFYQNGQIETEGLFMNDKPEGTWTFYYHNGFKKEEGEFKQGERTGIWSFYDSLGRLDSIKQF